MIVSKSAMESEDELVGGLDEESESMLCAPSGMVIVIGDGACGGVGNSGGVVADERNLLSGPQSGHHLDARTLSKRKEMR